MDYIYRKLDPTFYFKKFYSAIRHPKKYFFLL